MINILNISEIDVEMRGWFRPARGQFSIAYRAGREEHTYVPDFVAETAGAQLLIEVKAADRLEDASVLRKRVAARMVPRGERPRFGARAEALYTSDDPA